MGDPSPQELELIRRANAGDSLALEQLYRLHREWVVGLAMRFTGERDDALDVLQDVFARLFSSFPGFTLTTTVRGYLFPVVRNAAISLIRKRRKVVALDHASDEKLSWVPNEPGELERMVHGLAEPQRQVVLLRFGANLQLDEIAEALGVPQGTVKSRLFHALRNLREKLAGLE